MDENHPNVVHGAALTLEIPKISLGQYMFAKLKTHNPYDVLMFEADIGRLITPVEFLTLSIRVATSLKKFGVNQGDVVAIVGKAKIDVYATATGVLFRGATVFPVDVNLPPDVFRLLMKTTAPKFVFCDAEIVERVTQVLSELNNPSPVVLYNENPEVETSHEPFERFIKAEVDFKRFRPTPSENPGESLAFLVCSSGTMGVPKPVMLTDRNLVYQATAWRIITSSNKIMLCPAISFSYFFWISGVLMYIMNVCINFEMTIVQELKAGHILRVIERQKPVWGMFSPALVKYLTWQPDFENYDVSSLMLMIMGGTSLPKVVVEKTKELWGSHLSCRQSYGVTEVSGAATTCGMDDDVLSVGRLISGFQMKIISVIDGRILGAEEEGEIFLKSPSLMKGYLGNEKASKEVLVDGWYKTGDIGRYTDTGLIYITGRVKDFIKCNNKLISPLEIEEVIMCVPGVADAGVVGIPTIEDNQLLVALVTKIPGSDVTQEDIIKCVCEKLPESKHLRGGVFFVDYIPRTSSGKMKRTDLLDKAKVLFEL